jgi:hypothetical protein
MTPLSETFVTPPVRIRSPRSHSRALDAIGSPAPDRWRPRSVSVYVFVPGRTNPDASWPSSLSALRLVTRASESTFSGGLPAATLSSSAGPPPWLVRRRTGAARSAIRVVISLPALLALPNPSGSPTLARPSEAGPTTSATRTATPSTKAVAWPTRVARTTNVRNMATLPQTSTKSIDANGRSRASPSGGARWSRCPSVGESSGEGNGRNLPMGRRPRRRPTTGPTGRRGIGGRAVRRGSDGLGAARPVDPQPGRPIRPGRGSETPPNAANRQPDLGVSAAAVRRRSLVIAAFDSRVRDSSTAIIVLRGDSWLPPSCDVGSRDSDSLGPKNRRTPSRPAARSRRRPRPACPRLGGRAGPEHRSACRFRREPRSAGG